MREPEKGVRMATYRVVLRIDVSEDDIIRNRGENTLKELKEGGSDFLLAHIENEMGWLEHSFSRLETESVTRLSQVGKTSRRTSPRTPRR